MIMSNIRKFLVAAAGTLVLVLTTVLAVGPEIIPTEYLPYIQVIIALITSKGVHKVRNVPRPVSEGTEGFVD